MCVCVCGDKVGENVQYVSVQGNQKDACERWAMDGWTFSFSGD